MNTQKLALVPDKLESLSRQLGIPAFIMSLYFWLLWINPLTLGKDAASGCSILLVLEFLSIHSTAFIAGFSRDKIPRGLIGMYIAIIAVISVATGTLWPVLFFAWHIHDTIKDFQSASDVRIKLLADRWIGSTIIFIVAIMIAANVPLPDLGWRPGIVDEQAAWVEEGTGRLNYHLTPAWGTIYFFLQGLMILYWPDLSRKLPVESSDLFKTLNSRRKKP